MPNGPSINDPTAGELIYAVGDIHGCLDPLNRLLDLIRRDWQAYGPDRRPLLVFCGDYVDRGLHSAEVIDALIALQAQGDIQTCCLKGNHEQSFMRFLADPTDCERWLRFGGVETLASYGVSAPSPEDREDCQRARDLLRERMPASHMRFLEGLELTRVVGLRLRPRRPAPRNRPGRPERA
jgi:serine/threonine protein phosphatase 1